MLTHRYGLGRRTLRTAMALWIGLCMAGCETKSEAAATTSVAVPTTPDAPTAEPTATTRKDTPERAPTPGNETVLHPALRRYVGTLLAEMDQIPAERKLALEKLALFIKAKRGMNEPAKLTFICTHNSRRSHLSQIWAQTAAAYYGVEGIETYSGGTEVTAFNPRAVAAVQRAGFEIVSPDAETNPRYKVSFGPDARPMEAYSKHYDAEGNPREQFAAVMTCTQADKSCPVVEGAALRIALPYEDPKVADDSDGEVAKYDERTRQIATEMFYVFSRLRG